VTVLTPRAPLDEDGAVAATSRQHGRDNAEARQATVADLLEGSRPVNTRAVLAAALLGAAEPELPVAHLVAIASLFGISPGAARTSLWRMVTDGELTTDKATYALAGRLLDRRNQVDTAARTEHGPGTWDGTWDLAIVAADRRAAMDRIGLRKAAAALHLAEIREGTWTRPNNLDPERLPAARAVVDQQCTHFRSATAEISPDTAADLFGLHAWAQTTDPFLGAMRREIDAAHYTYEDSTAALSHQFTLSIAVVTHLERDPLLPLELLPVRWPAEELRLAYRDFDHHFQRTMNAAVGTTRS
jgi:phenylacetic acid degradation operon negative regulatory protein